jgi:hypothetical protein
MFELYFLFIGLLILLIVGLGVLLGSMDIKNIQAEWDKRRCEPATMFSAFLYKPSTDPRSSAEFAGDNFSFCMRSLIDEVFKELLSPVMGVFSQQMAAASTTGGVLNSIRNQLGNTFRSFTSIFDDFFETYKRGTMQLARITQQLRQAMLKVSAAVVSIVFMGISLMTSLLNTYDFIVKVVIIIMAILVALIIILFFALIPFMPIIFTTIAILTGAGLGSAVGGFAGAFCIDPEALVLMSTGTSKKLKNIRIGDILGANCGKVEGILETDTIGPLYDVEGIIMSGSHMVYTVEEIPVFAKDYPGAKRVIITSQRPDRLIILNTSTRKIPLVSSRVVVVGNQQQSQPQTLLVGDWEEIPEEDKEGQDIWEKLVWKMLNGAAAKPSHSKSEHTNGVLQEALFSSNVKIFDKEHGSILIESVKRGAQIRDINGTYTKVLGVYRGLTEIGFNSMTRGVRFSDKDGIWKHVKLEKVNAEGHNLAGYNLVTESGTFIIHYDKDKLLSVRDFTEVGYNNIEQTYESTRTHLATNINKKKEIQQQNSNRCVLDFSSQACCFCWPQTSS